MLSFLGLARPDLFGRLAFWSILVAIVGLDPTALAQNNFLGVLADSNGAAVGADWSSDFGPDLSASLGWQPGSLHVDETKSAQLTGDPWPAAIGPLTPIVTVTVPPASAFPHEPVVTTLDLSVRNLDGGVGVSAGGSSHLSLLLNATGQRLITIDWSVQYVNSGVASGTGFMSYVISIEGLGYLINQSMMTGSFADSGTIHALLPTCCNVPQNPKVYIGANLSQGQSAAGEGRLVFEVGIRATACSSTANDTSYGTGKAGPFGIPTLTAGLPLKPGATGTLSLSNGKPGAAAYLLIGAAPANAPLNGGTLLVSPFTIIQLKIQNDGTLVFSEGPIPYSGVACGVTLYHQVIIPEVPWTMSNGVARTIGL